MSTVSLAEWAEIGGLETEQIKWASHFHQMSATDLDILQSGLDGAMAQQELNGVGIDTGIE